MNMTGNLAGFVAPVLGGMLLEKTAGNWNALIYTMVASAAMSAFCWVFLHPEHAGHRRNIDLQAVEAGAGPD